MEQVQNTNTSNTNPDITLINNSLNNDKNTELIQLEKEKILLKRNIEDLRNEVFSLKSSIFILKEKNDSYSQENTLLNNEISKKNNSLNEYISKINDLNIIIKDLEKENTNLKNDIRLKENEINDNNANKMEVENDIEELKNIIKEKQERILNNEKVIKDKTNKINELELNLNNTKDNIYKIKQEHLLLNNNNLQEINNLSMKLKQNEEEKNIINKEKDEINKKYKFIFDKNNNFLNDISKLNYKIEEINQQLLDRDNLLKIKEREIQKEINNKNNINQLYMAEKQKNNKLQNEFVFLQQIINDKENEINNLRKSSRLYDTKKFYNDNFVKDIEVGDVILLKKELNNLKNSYNKLVSENEILKIKNDEYLSLQIEFNELSEKYNILNNAKNEYLQYQRDFEEAKNDKNNLIQENQKLKKLIDILNNQNKKLLYESTMIKSKSDFVSINNKISNNDNKNGKYLSVNTDELSNKLNSLFKDNIEYEAKLNKSYEEKECLNKRISELETIVNDMNIYVEDLEKSNEQYKLIIEELNNSRIMNINKNSINILNDKTLNNSLQLKKYNSLNLQRIKSNASSNKKNICNLSMMEEEDNNDLSKNMEILRLKTEKKDLNKKLFELNYELKNEKEKYDSILNEKNILKEENNKLVKEKNDLSLNCNKLNNEINILNERINNLNLQIQNKMNETDNLTTKISSIIKSANEKFEETKEIFEQNVHKLRKDNNSWRKACEKFLGKKKSESEEEKKSVNLTKCISTSKNKIMDIDENREKENNYKNEINKLKIIIDNLKTENSLLKYRLSIFNTNKANIFQNSYNNMNNYNNNLINSSVLNENIKISSNSNNSIEAKYLESLTENKKKEEIIKKLEQENKDLRYNITNNLLNTNINSAYNYLMKELENLSKEKSELEMNLNNVTKEKNDTINKYIYIDLENKHLKIENNGLKNINQNLINEIQKYKSEDILKEKNEKESLNLKIQELSKKSKNEADALNLKIQELEKEKMEKNEKLDELKKQFNHDYGVSKKMRIILNYLIDTNKQLESKINEYSINKEKYEKKIIELEQKINDNNNILEEKQKNLKEYKRKLDEQIFKSGQINTEFLQLVEISKEKNDQINNDFNIKNGFNDLLKCLNKYKEIVPLLNSKWELCENENKILKEQIEKLKVDSNNQNNEIIKGKDKEIEDLKNAIENNRKEKEKIENEKNLIKAENVLFRDDIISIGNYFNSDQNNIKKGSEDDNLISELLNQLIKAKNIISFLLPLK